MKYLRILSALFACLFALSLCACAPHETAVPDDNVIDITLPDKTPGQDMPAPGSTLTPLIIGTPGQNDPLTPPATPAVDATPPTQTQAPVQTQPPANTPQQTVAPTAVDGLPYYLYVEKGSFTLTIYEKGDDGLYSKVYKAYRIAHGGNKTPAGTFTLNGDHERWHEFPDGGVVQYATRYHARLYLHSPLYATANNKEMWPKYYDGELGIGKESTGGCLRMVTEAARFIYENCPDDTVLEIVNGSPKGTTSDDVPSRNGKRYDPTDVDAR